MRETTDTKVSEEEKGGGSPGAAAEILLHPEVKAIVRCPVRVNPPHVFTCIWGEQYENQVLIVLSRC